MNSTLPATRPSIRPATDEQTIIASYGNHGDAEAAVRLLLNGGIVGDEVSIIGRKYETHEDVQGFYRPSDAVRDGAGQGAWYGGLFGLMLGAFGFFVLPVIGGIMVIGPLAGLIAGAIGGAGAGALINALIATGVPQDQAIKYQERLQAGEFLVVVHGSAHDTSEARSILETTTRTHLETHSMVV